MLRSVEQCKTEFERGHRLRTAEEPLWVNDLRCQGLDAFLTQGFPTGGARGWNEQRMARLAASLFTLASPTTRRPHVPFAADMPACARLVFVDGYFCRDLSDIGGLPEGVFAGPLSAAVRSNSSDVATFLGRIAAYHAHPFVALNTAMFPDAACVLVPPDAQVETPIYLQFVSTGTADLLPAMSHPRALVIVGDGASATVLEHHLAIADVTHLSNSVAEIVVGEEAALDYCVIQSHGRSAYSIGAASATIGQRGTVHVWTATLGTALARTDMTAVLAAPDGVCEVTALGFADGDRFVHVTSAIDHAASRCTTRQRFGGVLDDHGIGVFEANLMARDQVRPAGAHREGRAVLLSTTATLHSDPPIAADSAGWEGAASLIADAATLVHGRELGSWLRQLLMEIISQPLPKQGI